MQSGSTAPHYPAHSEDAGTHKQTYASTLQTESKYAGMQVSPLPEVELAPAITAAAGSLTVSAPPLTVV